MYIYIHICQRTSYSIKHFAIKPLSLPNTKWGKNIPAIIWVISPFITDAHDQWKVYSSRPFWRETWISLPLSHSSSGWCHSVRTFPRALPFERCLAQLGDWQGCLWGRDEVAEPNGSHFWSPAALFLLLLKVMHCIIYLTPSDTTSQRCLAHMKHYFSFINILA